MRLSRVTLAPLLLVPLLFATDAESAQRGVVKGLSIAPTTARIGAEISATISGVNPCGAVFVDWGDGTAVTHPISELPTTRTHTYAGGGSYAVTARGMGNCDGEASGTVRIEGPPAPSTRRELTAFTVSSPAVVDAPVKMAIEGQGRCSVDVAFGDGNTQQFSMDLPHTFTHVYAEPRLYNVTAAAVPPCTGGRHTARLEITRRPVGAAIARLVAEPNPAAPRARVSIRIEGSGTCRVTVDFDDGAEEAIEGALPLRIFHSYARPGRYEVFAWTESPCSGDAGAVIQVRR